MRFHPCIGRQSRIVLSPLTRLFMLIRIHICYVHTPHKSGFRFVNAIKLVAMLRAWILLSISAFAAGHSIKPLEADSTATDAKASCTAKLIRRTSKSVACFPEGDTRRGGHFGCVNNSAVFVTGKCAGLFQCSNGYTAMCTSRSVWGSHEECVCSMPCHLNNYVRGDLHAKGAMCPPTVPPSPNLPPLPPVPPMPPLPPFPPPPAAPARSHAGTIDEARCEKWCGKREGEGSEQPQDHLCKCASCSFASSPLAEGAPCRHGHAAHHALAVEPPPSASPASK